MSFTGLNATGSTVTFAGEEYSSEQYPISQLAFFRAGVPVVADEADGFPVEVVNTAAIDVEVTNATAIAVAPEEADVNILTMPGLAAIENTIVAKQDISNYHSGLTEVDPGQAAIGETTSGSKTIISATPARQIIVTALFLFAGGTQNVYFTDGSGGANLIGKSTAPIPLTAQTGFVLPEKPTGWARLSTNTALVMVLSANETVAGVVHYALEP